MILAILQARVSSSRLPEKVLRPILGKPMLQHQVERIQRSHKVDKVIVATSTDTSDDKIQALCQEISIDCFRGSLDNVLDRYYNAAKKYNADHIIRLTGDCPLLEPSLIDEAIAFYQSQDHDYICNTVHPTFPDGYDIWVFRFSALEKAWKEAQLLSEKEHVVMYIKNHPELFQIGSWEQEEDLSALRWTVDEAEDFALIEKIYQDLYPENPHFGMKDILAYLEKHPHLKTINTQFQRDEGLQKSLREDQQQQFLQSKSGQMQARAIKRIPGMTQLLSKRPDQFSRGVWPGYYKKAQGVEVWDLDDNKYIDMSIGGIGANILGYADPIVDKAVCEAVAQGVSCSLNCPEEVELADLLCEIHPWADQVRYSKSGGEAATMAVRIARAHTGKDKIAFCGYHGWHDWYLAANLGNDSLEGHLLPGLDPAGVPQGLKGTAIPFHYNKIEELKEIIRLHKNDLAAIIMEPIRNTWPQGNFLKEVRELADEAQVVLIFDEISAGFRMNSGGAHLLLGVEPDLAIFAKAIGNGYPIAAVIGRERIMRATQSSFISSTNWTERVGASAALATIREHQKHQVGEHLMKIGKLVQEGWRKVAQEHQVSIEVGGIPPLSHFTFQNAKPLVLKALFVQLMLEKGFLASNIFYAMHAHQETHVQVYLEAAEKSFAQIAQWEKEGSSERQLVGAPAVAGFKRLN